MTLTTSASISTVGASATQKHVEASDQAKQPETDGSKQEAQQPPADAYGNAVVVSVSGDRSTQTGSDAERYSSIELVSTEDAEKFTPRSDETLGNAKRQRSYAKLAEKMKTMLEYIEQEKPIPERTLTGDDADAARKRFKDADPVMTSTDGAKSFLENEMLYRFEANGTITVRHQLIPTSEEAKQNFLDELRGALKEAREITGGKSIEEIDREIANIEEGFKNALARESQATSQAQTGEAGQLVDNSV